MANLIAHLAADMRTQPADWIAEVVAKLLFRRRLVPRAGVFTSPPSAMDAGNAGDAEGSGGGGSHGAPSTDPDGEYVTVIVNPIDFDASLVSAASSGAAFTSQLSTVGPA